MRTKRPRHQSYHRAAQCTRNLVDIMSENSDIEITEPVPAEDIPLLLEVIEETPTVSTLSLKAVVVNRAAARALAALRPMKSVVISGIDISYEDLIPIVLGFATNSTLTSFSLHWNPMDSDITRAVATMVERSGSLTDIDLSYNHLGSDGACLLANALTNSNIARVSVIGNRIGVDGARAFAHMLTTNSSIETLVLNCNEIGDEGADVLAQALETSMVKNLSLNQNGIGGNGTRSLASMLTKNSVLTRLCMIGNSTDSHGASTMVQALEQNFTLMYLSMTLINVSDDTTIGMCRFLIRNCGVAMSRALVLLAHNDTSIRLLPLDKYELIVHAIVQQYIHKISFFVGYDLQDATYLRSVADEHIAVRRRQLYIDAAM